MSDTPRTDAVVGTIQINDPHCLGPAQVVSASFARQLERELNARSEALQRVVDEQAEDEALWFEAKTAPEAYLQAALRRLHGVIEGDSRFDTEESKP